MPDASLAALPHWSQGQWERLYGPTLEYTLVSFGLSRSGVVFNMLIDVSRKPARVLTQECPSVVVLRSMAVKGTADGLIHQKLDGKRVKKDRALTPLATVPNGTFELMETLLPAMRYGTEEFLPNYYTISGCQDQVTIRSEVWRVAFLLDKTRGSDFLLTLLDETDNVMLFTVQVSPAEKHLFNLTTPLRRYLNRQINNGAGNLWDALLEED